MEITERKLSVGVLYGKGGRGRADARWPGAAIAAYKQNCKGR